MSTPGPLPGPLAQTATARTALGPPPIAPSPTPPPRAPSPLLSLRAQALAPCQRHPHQVQSLLPHPQLQVPPRAVSQLPLHGSPAPVPTPPPLLKGGVLVLRAGALAPKAQAPALRDGPPLQPHGCQTPLHPFQEPPHPPPHTATALALRGGAPVRPHRATALALRGGPPVRPHRATALALRGGALVQAEAAPVLSPAPPLVLPPGKHQPQSASQARALGVLPQAMGPMWEWPWTSTSTLSSPITHQRLAGTQLHTTSTSTSLWETLTRGF